MSLIDRATELEYYPEQQLIQMSQDPQGQYPQFLVLSEIQRRNNMRRMYQNEVNKMNQPSTTVAEEAVMEFAGQGAVPMMDASSSLSSTSEGGLRSMAPIPMQNDVIPMQSGRSTALVESFANPMQQEISNEELEKTQSILSRLPRNPDGSIDKSEIAKAIGSGLLTATAIAAVLFPEPTTSALGTARLATTGFGRNLLQLPKKITTGLQSFMGRRAVAKDPTKRFGAPDASGLRPLQTSQKIGQQEIKNLKIPTRLLGLTGLSVAGSMVGNGEELPITSSPAPAPASVLATAPEPSPSPAGVIDSDSVSSKGLSADDALTLAQIGGVFGGARNLGEAAVGLGNLAAQIQKTRREDVAEGLQGRLVEANIAKLEADIANMEPIQINTQLATVQDLIKNAIDSGAQEELAELLLIQQVLNRKLLELRGISLPQGGGLTEGIPGVTVT